jgi:D-glycero-D-manno-heptose 1,7-bisphosphate phosphatase
MKKSKPIKALFLDRDGVINKDYGYVYKIENFKFTDYIFDLIKLFQKKDYLIFIVTNQSGIGRGYYSLNDFLMLTDFMLEQFNKNGIKIEQVKYCPHSPKSNCNCRKPKTGMIDSILKEYNINLEKSWLFGDKQSDMDLAKNVKIKNKVAIGQELKDCDFSFKTIKDAYMFLKDFNEL